MRTFHLIIREYIIIIPFLNNISNTDIILTLYRIILIISDLYIHTFMYSYLCRLLFTVGTNRGINGFCLAKTLK